MSYRSHSDLGGRTGIGSVIAGAPEREGEVFHSPWEARALAQQISRAQAEGDPDLGDTYYAHWLSAMEALIARRGIAAADALDRARRAWAHAAERTPHGSPIELGKGDFEQS